MDAYQFRLRWVMSFPRRRESSKNERRSVLPAAREARNDFRLDARLRGHDDIIASALALPRSGKHGTVFSYWVPAFAGTTGLLTALPQRDAGIPYFVILANAGI